MTNDQRVRLQALLDKTKVDVSKWVFVEGENEPPELYEVFADHEALLGLVAELTGMSIDWLVVPDEIQTRIHDMVTGHGPA